MTSEQRDAFDSMQERASRWCATFGSEDDALVYAWHRPGITVDPVPMEYVGSQHWSVYRAGRAPEDK